MAIVGTLTGNTYIRTNLVGGYRPDSTQENGWDEIVSLDKGSLSIDFYYHVCPNNGGPEAYIPPDGKRLTVMVDTGVEKAVIIKDDDNNVSIQYQKKGESSYHLKSLPENWFYKHVIEHMCGKAGNWFLKALCIGTNNVTFSGGR